MGFGWLWFWLRNGVRSGCEVGGKGGFGCCFVLWCVLGGALVLGCTWDFGVGFGRCFVYCGFGRVDFVGRVEKWGKSVEGVRM